MKQTRLFRGLSLCFIVLALSACSTTPKSEDGAPVVDRSTSSTSSTGDAARDVSRVEPGFDSRDAGIADTRNASMSSSKAVVALLNDASAKRRSGDLKTSTALLERALRIEPKNPNVWYQLADVRFREKNYKLAESLAQKSNALSIGNPDLQIRNWRLISIARLKRGDVEGSRHAKQKALRIKKTIE